MGGEIESHPKDIMTTKEINSELEKLNGFSYTSIDVLEILRGRPLDGIAVGMIHALRPSRVRIIKDGEGATCDAVTWRVTVRVDEHNVISGIYQEVQIGCPPGIQNGYEMDRALER